MPDLVPYEQQPQPTQPHIIRYAIDFGTGPINVVLGDSGIYVTPLDSTKIEPQQIATILAHLLFMLNQLPQSTYQAFSEGINQLIYSLSDQVSDLSSLEEEVTSSYRGAVGWNDLSKISWASGEELTLALRSLYEIVNSARLQLPLPLKFDEPAELKSLP